ncbi:MAG: alpha-amylase [Spirochaetales bacterium]|nr:alpha-amylase [Candidatus Physcosoma equi]
MDNRDLRIAKITRNEINYSEPAFETGHGPSSYYMEASALAFKYNEEMKKKGGDFEYVTTGKLHASGVLHYVYQAILTYLLKGGKEDFFARRIATINSNDSLKEALEYFDKEFPTELPEHSLEEQMRGYFVHQVIVQNPALVAAARPFIAPKSLQIPRTFRALSSILSSYEKDDLRNGEPNTDDIFTFLCMPGRLYPDSLMDQLQYILREWSSMLSESFIRLLMSSIDYIKEEEHDHGFGGVPGPMPVVDFSSEYNEYEAFSSDSNWMPCVVMIAKSTLVWLDQLSKTYKRPITSLDQIPDEELDAMQHRGITALWLIGLWQRSEASATIKHLCGNPDAVASAYSLKDYDISPNIGGWEAVDNLRDRCRMRGIRLASDMVPNHTGIDGNWVYEHPDYFVSQSYSPYPNYTYNGPDLSSNPDWEVKIEDHYYDRTDAAVTFRMVNRHTGETKYVFHGNDGTTMPWNDTAQLDYLNPVTREAVIQKILHVARNFPIIRFDAAMTLAKRHIQRLWYPKPGTGGDIAGRAVHAIDEREFNARIPEEFWREVVDRVAAEVPDTLLLAEAFWMMEGYFVRTLGMHRVYNSAFMNMLKNQENQKYRDSIKKTLEFEPEILKRYVNFMNNPDEDTAIAQFGDGDRYFGVATLLSTLPGLPMIGHGQFEGFKEKYGMEYQRAYYDEKPNQWLMDQHERRIFPLLRKRYLFAKVDNFNIYDCINNGAVEESVYAFVNGAGPERTLVLVNNQFERVEGTINVSAPKLKKNGEDRYLETTKLSENLNLHYLSRKYCLMDCFSDGLTYLMPSISVYDGFHFALNGYETRVFWNIREVEDTDGCYERLWKEYGFRGVKNMEKAIALMRLEPVYKVLDKLRSKEVLETLDEIIHEDTSKEKERALLLTIAEAYSMLFEGYNSLEESAKGQLGSAPLDVTPQPVIKYIHALGKAFGSKGPKAFSSLVSMDKTINILIAATIVLIPFRNDYTARRMMEIADRLMLTEFFAEALEKHGLNEDQSRALMHEAALLVSATVLYRDETIEEKPITMLSCFLNDNGVMNLTGCHEWQGAIWYKKEEMQRVILICTLAYAVSGEHTAKQVDQFARDLLEREINSGYKLSGIFKS